MASLSDLPLKERLFLLGYRFRRVDPVPWARPRKPLARSLVALISTGGVSLPGQPPFDQKLRGGDFSFREIPSDVDVTRLAIGQRSQAFDHTGFERDRNLGFPLDRLREMAQRREIGSLAPRAFSLMGSITAPGRLVAQTAPAVADRLVQDGVDAALLVPLWPMCHQTVGLVAAEIEQRGIATTSITMLSEITRKVGVPRALAVPYPLGYPLGRADDAALQIEVLRAALSLLGHPGPPPVLVEFQPRTVGHGLSRKWVMAEAGAPALRHSPRDHAAALP